MAILLLTMIPLGMALASTYTITLYPITGSGGTGGFSFTNPDAIGCYPAGSPSVSVTGESIFNTSNSFCVQVAAVDYNDGKTNEEYGANQITGNYVEGLGGELENEAGKIIRFTFVAGGTNPSGFTKTYEIDNNGVIEGSGTYHVANNASGSVPEPGILVLISVGIAALGFAARRRRNPTANN